MKNSFILFSAMALLTSCSRYYVNTLASTNTKKDESTGQFIFENDSLKIAYNFFGDNEPLKLDIQNKLSEPLYINWQQSALINGDKATSYLGESAQVSGQVNGSSLQYGDRKYSSSSIEASVALPKEISFIPPKSRIERSMLKLAVINYQDIPDSLFTKIHLDVSESSGVQAQRIDFTKENSPMTLKSYLTFFTMKDNAPKYFAFQQDFFLESLTKTLANPSTINSLANKPGNVFYLSENTGYGNTTSVVGLVLSIATISALEHVTKTPANK